MGGTFSFLGTAAGIFFSGTIFFGASGTLEIWGLRILVCIAEEVPFFGGQRAHFMKDHTFIQTLTTTVS